METKTLYAKDATGSIRYWRVTKEGPHGPLGVTYGLLGGKGTASFENVPQGLGGRSMEEQVDHRMASMINKKLLAGYLPSLEEVEASERTNSLGFARPMLASVYDGGDLTDVYLQYKYDGHRCLIKNDGGELVAYSRNGKLITSVNHILDSLEGVLPEGMTLDGELYHHGTALQTISSWVRKEQEDSKKLTYVCYDVLLEGVRYSDRIEVLRNIFIGGADNVVRAHAKHYTTAKSSLIKGALSEAVEDGYEGTIARKASSLYEEGKRSKGLIKIKPFLDEEFTVQDITQTNAGVTLLHCLVDGKPFKVTAPGNKAEKQAIYDRKGAYIGKMVNIRYSGLTKSGIPFHPVATMWRNKDEE